ncbi:MAG TPA: CpsB/CapC family capsule biosynthesis tyrosine phosphatase [Longimicrobium sp.]|nr:CpsB/CapC family capsule biosynthesis tyrosine phosphatase [Longimicrobium sp.]
MIDLHSHLVPGVDDGAADLAEARAALERLRANGVTALVTTPHLDASTSANPQRLAAALAAFDPAFAALREMAAAEFPGLRVERGVELMLDVPRPVVDDPRLRLAGTRFLLVEFPFLAVPPNGAKVLFELRAAGWEPVLAHPERYAGVDVDLAGPEEWRRVGARLQVNWASLLGRYGPISQRVAWALLERGWADYLSSDHHARGRLGIAEVRRLLEERGGQEQLRLLSEENPARLLDGESPRPVPPLPPRRRSLLQRLLRRR